jgi:hypothetical protein
VAIKPEDGKDQTKPCHEQLSVTIPKVKSVSDDDLHDDLPILVSDYDSSNKVLPADKEVKSVSDDDLPDYLHCYPTSTSSKEVLLADRGQICLRRRHLHLPDDLPSLVSDYDSNSSNEVIPAGRALKYIRCTMQISHFPRLDHNNKFLNMPVLSITVRASRHNFPRKDHYNKFLTMLLITCFR